MLKNKKMSYQMQQMDDFSVRKIKIRRHQQGSVSDIIILDELFFF